MRCGHGGHYVTSHNVRDLIRQFPKCLTPPSETFVIKVPPPLQCTTPDAVDHEARTSSEIHDSSNDSERIRYTCVKHTTEITILCGDSKNSLPSLSWTGEYDDKCQ